MMRRVNVIETQGSDAKSNDIILDDGTRTVQGFEVAGLAGLDDFGTIYSWASRVARKVGKAIAKPAKMPVNLAPLAFPMKAGVGVFGENPLPSRRSLPSLPPKVVGNMPGRSTPANFAKKMNSIGLGSLGAGTLGAIFGRQKASAAKKTPWGASIGARLAAKKSTATVRSLAFKQRSKLAAQVKERAQAAAQAAAVQAQTTADPNVAQAAEIARRQAEDDARRAEQLQKDADARAKSEAELAQRAAEVERQASEDENPAAEGGPSWESEQVEQEDSQAIPEEYAEPEAVAQPETAEESQPSAGEGEEEEESAYMQGLGVLLGTNAKQAAAVTKSFSRAYVGFIPPSALLTKQGAAKVGVAGARAAAASKLYTTKAELTEKVLTKVAKEGDALPKGSDARKRKQVEFSVLTRDLISNRAQAERARVIASGATATLKFRKEAQTAMQAGKPEEAKQKLGQAAAAITVTQGFAQTPVRVALPAELSLTTTNELAKETGLPPPLPEPTKKVRVKFPLPSAAAPAARAHYAQGAKVPKGLTPSGHPNIPMARPRTARGFPQPPFSNYLRDARARRAEAAPTLRAQGLGGGPFSRVATTFRAGGADGLGGLGSIDGFLDFLKPIVSIAKQIIPSNTIVSKLLNGKTGEAAVSAVRLVTQQPKKAAPAVQPAAPAPQAPSAAEQSVAEAVTSSFVPQTSMQTGLLIGAGVLSVGLIAMLAFRTRGAPAGGGS